MTDQPHTPTTEDVRLNYVYLGGTVGEREFDRRTEKFDRWYAAEFGRIIAAAEQRGAARELRQAAIEWSRAGNDANVYAWLHYRADLLEGDDE